MPCACRCPLKPEKDIGSPGTGVQVIEHRSSAGAASKELFEGSEMRYTIHTLTELLALWDQHKMSSNTPLASLMLVKGSGQCPYKVQVNLWASVLLFASRDIINTSSGYYENEGSKCLVNTHNRQRYNQGQLLAPCASLIQTWNLIHFLFFTSILLPANIWTAV